MTKKFSVWILLAVLLAGIIGAFDYRNESSAPAKKTSAAPKGSKSFIVDLDKTWADDPPPRIWFKHPISDKNASSLQASIVETYYIPELNITHLVLKNGLNVCLKPTDFETDEVMIKLAAKGGYGVLPVEDQPSGELSSQIAWESGMGGLTSDQMSVFLYEHSLDLAIRIKAFSREIEGTASTSGVEAFLDSIRVVFKEPNFTEAALKDALASATKAIGRANSDYEQVYEGIFTQVNAPDVLALRPLTLEDLKSVDLKKAEDFFRLSFDNPADFICVIVGSFDLEETKKAVAKVLGTIPTSLNPKHFKTPPQVPFPPGVTNKVITLKGHNDCLTRITFPLQMAINDKSIHLVEFICQIIEARVRSVLTAKMQYSYGVDVSYEFPLYPYLDNPWISIRYRSSEQHVNMLKHMILSELGLLQAKGATLSEIEAIKRYQSNSEEYWLQDNFYWMSALSNYYLWNWNPVQIVRGEEEVDQLPLVGINAALRDSLILGNYSAVTAKP